MDYASIKAVHQASVALSLAGFVVRGIGSFNAAAWVRGRAAKTLPHAVDSVLLVSAVTMAWQLGLNPARTPWLGAKIIGLLAYIALGMVALRPARPLPVRVVAWVGALASFGYIASVAVTKSPLGFMLWF